MEGKASAGNDLGPKRVVVLQNEAEGEAGAIVAALRARDVGVTVVRAFAGEPVPRGIDGASGLVVLGGSMSANDDATHPFLAEERRLIRIASAAALPVLGICLGSQIVAVALGGHSTSGSRKEIGWYPVEQTSAAHGDPLFAELPPTFTPFHWHGDQIAAPPGAVVLARSAMTPVQAFRVGSSVYGLQFHLECDAAIIDAMVFAGVAELAEAGIDRARLGEGTLVHLGEQERLARGMFGAWAEVVAAH